MQQFPQGSGSKKINRNQKKMLISTVLTNFRFPSPWVTKAVLTQKLKELEGVGGRAQRHTPDAAPVASKDAALPSSFLPCLHPGTCCVRYYCLPIRHLASLLPFLSIFSSFLPFFIPSLLPSFLPFFIPCLPCPQKFDWPSSSGTSNRSRVSGGSGGGSSSSSSTTRVTSSISNSNKDMRTSTIRAWPSSPLYSAFTPICNRAKIGRTTQCWARFLHCSHRPVEVHLRTEQHRSSGKDACKSPCFQFIKVGDGPGPVCSESFGCVSLQHF